MKSLALSSQDIVELAISIGERQFASDEILSLGVDFAFAEE